MDVQRGAWAPHSRIVGIDAARGSAMITLVDRGLFLMLIAHLLGLSELLQIGVGPRLDWLLLLLPVLFGFDQLDSLVFWFAYLAAVLGVLFFLSWRWDKVRGNRFLSIGLRHLGQARSIAPARMRHRRHHWHLPRLAARKVRAK